MGNIPSTVTSARRSAKILRFMKFLPSFWLRKARTWWGARLAILRSSSCNFIFRSLEDAVHVDVPAVQVVISTGAGGQHIRHLFRPPGPEAGDGTALRHSHMDVYPGRTVFAGDGLAVLPGGGMRAHGVVEGVEHPAGFVQVADEQEIITLHGEMSCFRWR